MVNEVKGIANTLYRDPKFLEFLKKILIIIAIFGLLILMNRFLIINLADKNSFYLSLERTKEIFWGSSSVYSFEVNPTASELKDIGLNHLTNDAFNLPLFALISYLPFTFVKDFKWSMALWLAMDQIICYFILNVSLLIIEKKLKETYRIIATGLILIFYFIIVNILKMNLSLIQLLVILLGYWKIKENDYIFAGILLGFAFFNPIEQFIPLIILVALNFYNERGLVNGWMLISIVLFSMIFVIFDPHWLLGMIKAQFLKPENYPFLNYRQYLNKVFPTVNTSLVELIPMIVFVWIAVEWIRTPKENYLQELWLLSLGFTLAPLINMWDNPYSMVGYAFVFIFTVSLWYERATSKFRIFSAGINALVLIVLPILHMLHQHTILTNQEMLAYNLILMVIMLLNLYWVRLWVVNPYYSVNKLDKI